VGHVAYDIATRLIETSKFYVSSKSGLTCFVFEFVRQTSNVSGSGAGRIRTHMDRFFSLVLSLIYHGH